MLYYGGMRQQILDEIRRLASENGGQPPGIAKFSRDTGIPTHQWLGVIWAKWGDALTDAGFEPNQLNQRRDTVSILRMVAEACRHFGRFPSTAEIRLYRRSNADFPSRAGIPLHFPTKSNLLFALSRWCKENSDYSDVAAILPPVSAEPLHSPAASAGRTAEGSVYLMRSGEHYKIGRSDELERRVKEIRIALPEAASLVHVIRTDDPAGIEAYWHRRFADRRANGEWFKLGTADVAAFKKRRFQ